MKLLNAIPIAQKLAGITSGLMIATVVAISAVNYSGNRASIVAKTEEILNGVTQIQSERVADFFHTLDRDLTLRANSGFVADAIKAFTGAYASFPDPVAELQRIYIDDNPHPLGEKDGLVIAGTNNLYDWTHAKYHSYFDALQDAMGYYDVFLLDTEGNLIYSVFKEADFATNMNSGAWKDTGLARVFRRANEATAEAATVFDDFEAYAPSNGAPAAFIARPVFDGNGRRMGVLAFQAPIDAINVMMSGLDGLGETGEALLIGPDFLYRSDSRHTEDSDILQARLEADYIRDGLAGGSGFLQHADESGARFLMSYRPIEIFGVAWVILAKQEASELEAQLTAALKRTAVIAGGGILVAVGIMLAFARNISSPLTRLTQTVEAIARKEFDVEVPATHRGDELGHIAVAVEVFRDKLKTAEDNLYDIAFKSAAFEVSGAPMLMADMDFNVQLMNDAFKRMMRLRAEDFRSVNKDFDPENLMHQNMDIFHAIPGKARTLLTRPENLPFKTKIAVGNAYIGLLVDAILDVDGNQIGYVLDWKDQTYQMENQVIMEAIDSGQGRVELSLDRRVRNTNPLFAKFLGMQPDDVVGMSLDSCLTRESDGSGATDLWDIVAGGEGVFDRFRLTAGAKDIIIDGGISPVPNHKGVTNGFLLLGTDVTEERKKVVATELRQQEMAAAQSAVVEAFQSSLTRLSDGDLTAKINEEFTEEYEALRKNYNGAVTSLHDAMTDVLEATSLIRGDSNEIGNATEDLSKRTEHQAATLEETSAALNELTVSVQSASEGAKEASSVVTHARENAETSGEVVRDAVSAMEMIEGSSKAISNIIGVIDDIAFQTNLLALNAGVEAARAGDAGRGFAVVASEVRALAQRSSEAAKEINDLITSSGQQVQRGVSLVHQAGTALTEIVASVKNISDHVNAIASSSQEQSLGLAEINDAINELDKATQHNTAMVEETTAASQSLKNQAGLLSRTTSQFRIDDTVDGAAPEPEQEFLDAS